MFELKIQNKNTCGLDSEENDRKYIENQMNKAIYFIDKHGWREGYRNALAVTLAIIAGSLGIDGNDMQNIINEALASEGKTRRIYPHHEEMQYHDPGDRINSVLPYAKGWIIRMESAAVADIAYGIAIPQFNKWDRTKYVSIKYFD